MGLLYYLGYVAGLVFLAVVFHVLWLDAMTAASESESDFVSICWSIVAMLITAAFLFALFSAVIRMGQ